MFESNDARLHLLIYAKLLRLRNSRRQKRTDFLEMTFDKLSEEMNSKNVAY